MSYYTNIWMHGRSDGAYRDEKQAEEEIRRVVVQEYGESLDSLDYFSAYGIKLAPDLKDELLFSTIQKHLTEDGVVAIRYQGEEIDDIGLYLITKDEIVWVPYELKLDFSGLTEDQKRRFTEIVEKGA